jgi:hypothetical protein
MNFPNVEVDGCGCVLFMIVATICLIALKYFGVF